MAYMARTLTSMARGVVRRAASLQVVSPTNTTTSSLPGNCRYLTTHVSNITQQHIPFITQLKTQQIRQQHTKRTDQELASFLESEIEMEEENERPIPRLAGFRQSQEGAVVTLTQKTGNEKITVSFDVNQNVNVGGDLSDDGGEDGAGGPITSYPEFSITIEKSSGRSLRFNCNTDAEGDEEEGDLFHIVSVQAYKSEPNHDVTKIYEAEAENMDENLHEMLLDTLSERGVDQEFVDGLIDLSTAIEHRMYVDHLKSLRDFAKEWQGMIGV